MVMTEVFDKLKELQEVLAKKYSIEAKIAGSPENLEKSEELLAVLKKEYIEKNARYEEIKAKVEKLKDELAEAEKSREEGEKGMDNITTHREYEALDKQITEATERENSVRKELQKEEKNLDEMKEILAGDEELIKSQEADLEVNKESLNKEISEYKSQLEDLSKREEAITPGLDQEIVYKFQRIIQRNSEGIVSVRNGVCSGCHMILPGQFANEVHDGEKILFCPYCSRILYHEDVAEEEAENYFTMSETGTLTGFGDDDDSLDDLERDLDDVGEDEDGLDSGDEGSSSFGSGDSDWD